MNIDDLTKQYTDTARMGASEIRPFLLDLEDAGAKFQAAAITQRDGANVPGVQLAAGQRWKSEDFVFTGGHRHGRYFVPDGRPLDAGYVLRQFQAALTAANLPSQPFHALRHAYATLLLEQGEELGVVSRILGHSNIATTSDVYAHFTRKPSESAADRMDAVLDPKAVARKA